MFRTFIRHIQRELYPCLFCRQPPLPNMALCQTCHDILPFLGHTCVQCAYPLESTAQHCGSCLAHPPAYDQTIALFSYQPPIQQLITHFKFREAFPYGKLLCHLMLPKLQAHYQHSSLPEVLIPVPLHPKRLSHRGFNQSLEMAKLLGKSFRLGVDSTVCQRVRQAPPQSEVAYTSRCQNVKRAFYTAPHSYQSAAIIDDVFTTGSTAHEMSISLKNSGIIQVHVWIVARTLRQAPS